MTTRQTLNLYDAVALIEERNDGKVIVSWGGGTWPDGHDSKTFKNMATALEEIALIARDLEREQS